MIGHLSAEISTEHLVPGAVLRAADSREQT